MDIEPRTLPHSLEAEKATLGAAIVSFSAWPSIASVVRAEDFYRSAHRLIFNALQRLAASGVMADLLTLKSELARAGALDEAGGPAYVSALTDGVPQSSNAPHYAAIVREKARLRAAAQAANRLLAEVYADSRDAAAIVAECSHALSECVTAPTSAPVDAHVAAAEYIAALDAGTVLKPTGYADLDYLLGGLAAPSLVVLAARPSVGKTSLALGIARNFAARGDLAAFFSLETDRKQLGAQLVGWASRVPPAKVARGDATDADVARIIEAQETLVGMPLKIDHDSTTIMQVEAWCRRLIAEHGGIACVVVDYLQLLTPDRRMASRQEEVASFSRALKRLAKDLKTVVIALSQLSRATEGRADKRPHLSDLRESGALEQDADIGMLVFRPEMYKPTEDNAGIAEVIVAKNKIGPTGVVRLCFIAEFAEFANLAGGYPS